MITLNIHSLNEIQKMFAEHICLPLSEDGHLLIVEQEVSLSVTVEESSVKIGYSSLSELYRGMALLKDDLSVGDSISQPKGFNSLAAFLDCSRNAVPTVEMLERFIMDIAALGYDTLYLYTEDTFEMEGEPYFGHLRGRYSVEEIRRIDRFALQFGIELIPAIQTLAHLNAIFHWKKYDAIRDTADILLCDDEHTYAFLDQMIASIRSMYSTNQIQIGMDEAHMLGLGKYLSKNGYHSKMDIFLKHIDRVMEIVKKYDFKPIMWSDMFFKIASGKCTYEKLNTTVSFDPMTLKRIPKEMTLAYWNYSPQTADYYNSILEAHLAMGREIIFTGGFRKWVGFCPNLQFSLQASRVALASVKNHGIKKVIITGWGDNGAEGSAYLMIPGLALYSEMCYVSDMSNQAIDHRMKVLFGVGLEQFRLLEIPNLMPDISTEKQVFSANTNKTVLYNDPLLGQYDRHILPGSNQYFADCAAQLQKQVEICGRFGYIFETIQVLCEVLSQKAELGNHLRRAYQTGNREELVRLSLDIQILLEKLNEFHHVFRKNWLIENKIFGFDVQDIRIGALKARITYTSEVLNDYLNGKVATIPELMEDSLYLDCRRQGEETPLHFCLNDWKMIATANVL